ncbi:tRNA (adenosine(37)-N6)-threonylcarbamoyltransferase complex ATPase subunit type 1 TsaE [Candidatus Falkowbacteria bacterium]|nr:tRNA (adenosine(37)-N6)-threonylcarbamoyltransferase complex ATPase subunit type 1 TsaE [Candidatus Falkowbacteria bacterium]
MRIITKNAEQTIKFGEKFAKKLVGGEVVLLVGDLGSGKTTFMKGVARALGVKQIVNSPTFVIMKIYKTTPATTYKLQAIKNLVHIDAYRSIDLPKLENIGATEYFGRKDSVCFVEWGKFLEEILNFEFRILKVCKVCFRNIDENTREIVVKRKKLYNKI